MLPDLDLNCEIAINGWFAGDNTSGSGQYLNHLLAHLAQVAPTASFSLLLPSGRNVRQTGAAAAGRLAQRRRGTRLSSAPAA